MAQVICPECSDKIKLDDPELGDRFSCANCWADLSVTGLDPLTVAWFKAPGFDDDWDDDVDDDE